MKVNNSGIMASYNLTFALEAYQEIQLSTIQRPVRNQYFISISSSTVPTLLLCCKETIPLHAWYLSNADHFPILSSLTSSRTCSMTAAHSRSIMQSASIDTLRSKGLVNCCLLLR
ncbi:hypothetical protein VN97_g8868 [Penicillium thymicola]|uniref:Uncharacterized protein n=1 Tax=Penicillium thymicola TaxID=293382 RepID=A0AAI9TCH5_PENTH|nr:hypothetical protein VN97_g8868 [Penicillium thymicola]